MLPLRRVCEPIALATAITQLAMPVLAWAAPAPSPGLHSRPTAPLVRLPFPQDDGSLTPYTFQLGYSLMTLVYDTLMLRDMRGVPQPWLARSVEVSPDARQVVLRLAAARWQDGVPLTSADVDFTFQYMASHPHPIFTGELTAVQQVDTPDPLTAVVRLRQRSPSFVDQPLADMPIIPRHLWERLPPGRSIPDGLPVGSGPYRLVSHIAGQSYRFAAYASYFMGPPLVAAIDVPIIHDPEATFKAIENRQVDMIPASLPQQVLTRLRNAAVQVTAGPSYLGTVLMFNVRSSPFDRVEVRQAMAQALDLHRMADLVHDAVAADRGYIHPESPWASTAELHQADVDAAKRRLAPLNLPALEVLTSNNDPIKREAARQTSLALQRAGIRVAVREVTDEEVSRRVGEDGSTPSYQMAIWTSPPLASYDPDFLRRAFGSDPAVASLNYSGYRSTAFDAVADRVSTTVDPSARRSAVQEELRLLAADVPVVPLFFSNGDFAFRPAVYDGWVYVKGTGILEKRSFVGALPEPATPSPGVSGPTTTTDRPWFLYASIGVVALMAVALLAALVRRFR